MTAVPSSLPTSEGFDFERFDEQRDLCGSFFEALLDVVDQDYIEL